MHDGRGKYVEGGLNGMDLFMFLQNIISYSQVLNKLGVHIGCIHDQLYKMPNSHVYTLLYQVLEKNNWMNTEFTF